MYLIIDFKYDLYHLLRTDSYCTTWVPHTQLVCHALCSGDYHDVQMKYSARPGLSADIPIGSYPNPKLS